MSECSICRRPVAPRAENRAFPFCSPRCKTIDLGQWVDEKYRVPEDADTASLGSLGSLGDGSDERATVRMAGEKA